MISLNATLLVQVGLFLGLVFVLNRLMIQPIHKIILERERQFKEKRRELAATQEEIRQLAADYEARLRRAEMEARESHLALRRAADAEARNLIAKAQEQVNAINEKVRLEVAQELEKARQKLREQAEIISVSVTEKVLGRRV